MLQVVLRVRDRVVLHTLSWLPMRSPSCWTFTLAWDVPWNTSSPIKTTQRVCMSVSLSMSVRSVLLFRVNGHCSIPGITKQYNYFQYSIGYSEYSITMKCWYCRYGRILSSVFVKLDLTFSWDVPWNMSSQIKTTQQVRMWLSLGFCSASAVTTVLATYMKSVVPNKNCAAHDRIPYHRPMVILSVFAGFRPWKHDSRSLGVTWYSWSEALMLFVAWYGNL